MRYRETVEPDRDIIALIVLSVSHHRLAEAAAFLAPRLSQATVLIFGNIWAEPLAGRSLQAHSDPGAEEPRVVCCDTLAEARRLGVLAPRLRASEPYFAQE